MIQPETVTEFQGFVSQLSSAIGTRLASRFPREAVEQVCDGFPRDHFRPFLNDIVRAWAAHGFNGVTEARYDEAVAILLIHMVGPLNRLPLSESVERSRLLHAYLEMLDQLLQHEIVRRRFAGLSERLMKAA